MLISEFNFDNINANFFFILITATDCVKYKYLIAYCRQTLITNDLEPRQTTGLGADSGKV